MRILKSLILGIFFLFCGASINPAQSAQVANVEYIHKLLNQRWGIEVPYYPENAKLVANMEYLLTVVDRANNLLNEEPFTSYGTDPVYATKQAVDIIAVGDAVNRLITYKPMFYVTTTGNTSSFSFNISAAGSFSINWGDGTVDNINKTDTTNTTYSHTYDSAGEYAISIGGEATAYNTSTSTAAISFSGNTNTAGISGSLGAIFGTLPSGTQPRFYQTFFSNTNLTGEIPADLFAGISGAPASSMFSYTFHACSNLSGNIPENLFAGISGAPASYMFSRTFSGCSGLTGTIPENLFAGISGAPASSMFYSTFDGCSGLTGTIPENLFGNISGTPASSMFSYTFYGCSGLTGEIPLGLFGNLTNRRSIEVFVQTFYNCSGLTGPSARMPDGTYLYDFFGITPGEVPNTYSGATGLEDYPYIPTAWGGLGQSKSDFFITTTPNTSSFEFDISAAGDFTIDWGDGNVEKVTKSDTTNTTYSHTYDSAGEYTIGIGGEATAYNTSTTTAAISFRDNKNTAGISGSLGAIFGTLSDGTNPGFNHTFYNNTNLTGEIPADLFAGISGAPAEYMFSNTFNGCRGLTGTIPENLFAGISGAPASSMFIRTFSGCSGLTGTIPENLFAGISGAPADHMFYSTFNGCRGLTGTIPENLFAGISGAPADSMFTYTFDGCSGLTGTIPENLFAGISGTPADHMFYSTFRNCSGLTGTIPENLFAGISGAPASHMFSSTFYGCSGLTGIGGPLFAGISGAPAQMMFADTFSVCSGLTGEIPLGLFGNISGAPASSMFIRTFRFCSGLTGPSARMPNGTYLYDFFTGATETEVDAMYNGATGLEDYPYIPTIWGGLGQEKPDFLITTTPNTSSFSFKISAAGDFTIDWGDGDVETINKTNTTNTTYSHTYDSAGEYTIGIGGKATAYNTSSSTAAISFSSNKNTAGISGSLGAIFGTLDDGTQPRFYSTFSSNTNLTGEIPADLFAGISGAPASYMFFGTFSGCSNLSGNIPENLFGDLSGAPATFMFYYTFNGCSGLTGSIPENLFAGISGAPASSMFSGTFGSCSGLTGTIPENLFAGISGKPATSMFNLTFYGCSGLSGSIPENLFAGISGAPASYMFTSTFNGCSGLTGEIPLGLFGNLTNSPQMQMFVRTFYGCSGLTGPSARMPDGTYLYDFFTGATTNHVDDMYSGATGLEDYPYIPTIWGGLGQEKPDFLITTTPNTSSFEFDIGAAGDFTIDWGDGDVETINKTNTTSTTYSHTYDSAGEYKIGISGEATAYESYMFAAAISFIDNKNTAGISGSLGAIFGTLSDGTQPRFVSTFSSNTNLTGEIPADLFAGISGAPASHMFSSTFSGCSGLTGTIPENLFAGISGKPASNMFRFTFSDCSGLTGSIPENLFAGISGTPASYMFNGTFYGCSNLSGSIPENLFAGISGAPASYMFYNTFNGCSGLTGIGGPLFAGITGAPASYMFYNTFYGCSNLSGEIPLGLFGNLTNIPQRQMFYQTFYNCSGLTGPSARMPDGTYLYDFFTGATDVEVEAMYYGATGLSDYSSIPSPWKI